MSNNGFGANDIDKNDTNQLIIYLLLKFYQELSPVSLVSLSIELKVLISDAIVYMGGATVNDFDPRVVTHLILDKQVGETYEFCKRANERNEEWVSNLEVVHSTWVENCFRQQIDFGLFIVEDNPNHPSSTEPVIINPTSTPTGKKYTDIQHQHVVQFVKRLKTTEEQSITGKMYRVVVVVDFDIVALMRTYPNQSKTSNFMLNLYVDYSMFLLKSKHLTFDLIFRPHK